ncbi:MAG: ATP-grasp domain-containing protein [Firmicutes bacterium]|nr:ATP-grasp domain-containing protein [Bacillota bacterium]
MKKVLILGAGIYQVPLIRAAKNAGLYTIVSSIPGDWPGFAEADQIYCVNTTDKEGILQIAREEKIDGICTTGTDVAAATIGYVNEKLGLHGLSEASAARTSDKTIMQETFHRGNVSSAAYIRADSPQEAMEAAEKIGYPVVVKCVDSSGSRGITAVHRPEDIEQAFAEALAHSRKDYVIVEEKLAGVEIGVDGLIQDGKLVFLAPHHKIVCKRFNKTITAGHSFPYHGSDALLAEIEKQIRTAIEAMGFDNSAFNSDAFVDGDHVSIIEIGGRAGATCIPELITHCFGFNYYEQILRLAFGQPVELPGEKATVPCMAKLIMSPVDGFITKLDREGFEELRRDGVDLSMDFAIGHAVDSMINGSQRIGQFIVPTQDEEELNLIERRVNRCIYVNGKTLDELWQQEELQK